MQNVTPADWLMMATGATLFLVGLIMAYNLKQKARDGQ